MLLNILYKSRFDYYTERYLNRDKHQPCDPAIMQVHSLQESLRKRRAEAYKDGISADETSNIFSGHKLDDEYQQRELQQYQQKIGQSDIFSQHELDDVQKEIQQSQDYPNFKTSTIRPVQVQAVKRKLFDDNANILYSTITSTAKSTHEQCSKSSKTIKKMRIDQGAEHARNRLLELGFILSLSQPVTPSDGNCFMWAICDQLNKDSLLATLDITEPRKLRQFVLGKLESILLANRMLWIDDETTGTQEEWKKYMSTDGVFADHYFIQLCAEVFDRPITMVPVFHEDGFSNTGLIEISPSTPTDFEPFYLLYYSESRFQYGHYQSIQKAQTRSQLPSIPENCETTTFNPVQAKKRKIVDSIADITD